LSDLEKDDFYCDEEGEDEDLDDYLNFNNLDINKKTNVESYYDDELDEAESIPFKVEKNVKQVEETNNKQQIPVTKIPEKSDIKVLSSPNDIKTNNEKNNVINENKPKTLKDIFGNNDVCNFVFYL